MSFYLGIIDGCQYFFHSLLIYIASSRDAKMVFWEWKGWFFIILDHFNCILGMWQFGSIKGLCGCIASVAYRPKFCWCLSLVTLSLPKNPFPSLVSSNFHMLNKIYLWLRPETKSNSETFSLLWPDFKIRIGL